MKNVAITLGFIAFAGAFIWLTRQFGEPTPPPPVHVLPHGKPAQEPREWSCYDMPNRDVACANLSAITRATQPSGVVFVTAPFLIIAPNKTARVRGHAMEVACDGRTVLAMALQDQRGTRYSEAKAGAMPAHTRALAGEICEAP